MAEAASLFVPAQKFHLSKRKRKKKKRWRRSSLMTMTDCDCSWSEIATTRGHAIADHKGRRRKEEHLVAGCRNGSLFSFKGCLALFLHLAMFSVASASAAEGETRRISKRGKKLN